MADGFEENVEFFTLTYEAPLRVASNREFAKIAPLLWIRAGSRGRRIDDISAGWDVADVYGVLADLDHTAGLPQGRRRKRRRRDRLHRDRRGSPLRVRRAGAARPRRARASLRGVPAQLRDRVRARIALKFTLKDYQEQAVDDVLAQPQARPRELQEPGQARDLVVLADGHHRSGKDGDGRGRNRGAVLGQRRVRLRSGPRCGRALVFRRPEPEQADVQPASAGLREVHLFESRAYRAAVRQAASRSRQGVLPEHPETHQEFAADAWARRNRARRATAHPRPCGVRARHAGLDDMGDPRQHHRGRRSHPVPRAG